MSSTCLSASSCFAKLLLTHKNLSHLCPKLLGLSKIHAISDMATSGFGHDVPFQTVGHLFPFPQEQGPAQSILHLGAGEGVMMCYVLPGRA